MLTRTRAAVLMWWAARYGFVRQLTPARRIAAAGRAVALLRRSPTSASPGLARALTVRAECLLGAGRAAEAAAAAREALGIYGERCGLPRADAHHVLARALDALDRLDEAPVSAELAVSDYRAQSGFRSPRLTGRLAVALYTQSLILDQLGRQDEALLAAEESVRLMDAVPLLRSRWTMRTHWRAQCHLVGLLCRAGRYAEALRVGEQVLDIVNPLVLLEPAHARPFRAQLLVYLAQCHRRADRLEKAAAVAEKGIADYRELGEQYRAGTAWALEVCADQLTALGRHGDADAARSEASEIYTSLADAGPDRYRDELYRVVDARCDALWDTGDRDRAVALGFGFLPVLRTFATVDPDTYEPLLADRLAVWAARASVIGRDDALEHVDQAVAVALRRADHEDYGQLLALCQHNRAVVLMNVGRHAEAGDPAQEAVQVLRSLVAADPATHETDLAFSLALLGRLLYILERSDAAATYLAEAAEILRRHTDDPRHGGQLADVLHWLGLAHSDVHRHAEAIDVLGESIELRRRLLDGRQHADQEARLGQSLRQRSLDLDAISRHDEAQTDIDEAVQIFRGLASTDADRYQEELARSQDQSGRQQAKSAEDGRE